MIAMFCVLLLLVIGIAFYLFFFIKRICNTFGIETKKIRVKVLIGFCAFFLSALSTQVTSMHAITILHIVFLAMFVQFINFLIKKIAKKRYNEGLTIWKKLYGSGVIPIILTVIIIILGYYNLHNVVETNYTIYTKKDIRSEGYKVALISDVHFGVSLNYDELLDKCKEISENELDIVILCGDIVDNNTTTEEMRSVFQALGTIESKYGIYYVHGNHDRPMKVVESEFTEVELIDTISENNITILQDDVVQITDDFILVGREDRSVEHSGKARASINELTSEIDYKDFILTLDHQPNQYDENGKAGTDLLLSGHTHGGQLFPLNIIQEIIPFNDGLYGLYDIDEDTQAIVTSGLAGWAYPIKTAAPAEYVIINIEKQ